MRWLRYILIAVLLTAIYFGAARLGLFLQYQYNGVTPLWPAAGIGLALLWLYGWRFAPVIVAGEFCIALWLGQSVWAGIAGGLIQLGEAALAAWLLMRSSVVPAFSRARDVGLFIGFGAVLPAILAGLAGGAELLANGIIASGDYWVSAWTWGLGDALGVLIVAPLIIQWRNGWPFKRRRETAAWAAVMVATLALAFVIMLVVATPRGLFFLLLPLAVVGAVTSGMAGASSVAALLALCVLGLNLSQVDDGFTAAVRMLFVGTAAITAYLLAVLVQERRQADARLLWQATHDVLTGLANRASFDEALKRCAASPGTHLLLYLDLDQFKLLNDSRGHEMGDRFLAGLAADLADVAPAEAVVARLGGDEFGVLLTEADEDTADWLAEALRQTVLDYRYTEDGLTHRVGVSIGATLFGDDDGPAAILSRADIACYAAKREGRNRIHTYRRDDPAMRADHMEIHRVAQLHAALADGHFQLARQLIAPLKENGNGAPPFYEVLLRLTDTDGRVLGPDAFLGVAARYGLMPIIDRWVVERSFQCLASSAVPVRLSINLSGVTLNDPAFLDDVMALQKRYNIDPCSIVFEVTESVAIQHLTRAIDTMNRFVEAGFSFALDDFGNGVASFGYLQELPVSWVKIDGRFIRDINLDPANPIIVESLVKLAAVKNIGCIGEWIETADALAQVKALGVEYGQGFYLHKPETLTSAADFHRSAG